MGKLLEQRRSLNNNVKQYEKRVEELEEQLNHVQSLASVGMTWAMVSHEINNILTPIINYASLAIQCPDDKALTEKALQKASLLSEKAATILRRGMKFAGQDEAGSEKVFVNLQELIEDVFATLGRDISKDRITCEIEVDRSLSVFANPTGLGQVLLNIIVNARQALLETQKTRRLSICAEMTETGTIIKVSDSGAGISKDNLNKIFEPFFTTKADSKSGSGHGLGLTFCKRIIEAHDGAISVESTPDVGTTFKIMLPNDF